MTASQLDFLRECRPTEKWLVKFIMEHRAQAQMVSGFPQMEVPANVFEKYADDNNDRAPKVFKWIYFRGMRLFPSSKTYEAQPLVKETIASLST